MVKSRKAKAKNSDFQKVKLKIGKRLPKGLNETNASFKSSSIQIKEQLKQRDSSLPHTRKKYTLQDLLPQCMHYSALVRTEALLGLCELGKSSPHTILENLPSVLEKISGLILDQDYNVRCKILPLVKDIFLIVSVKQISPFFPLLTSHIICAMTHLNEEIQKDSLPIVDLCLESYPELMTEYSDRLLTCFIKQIASPGSKKAEKYSLITNPSSRRSTLPWRVQVLKRVQQVLAVQAQAQFLHSECNNDMSEVIMIKGTCDILSSSVVTEKNMSFIKLNRLNEATDSISEEKFVYEDLVPLLVQCWIEAKPNSGNEGGSLSQDSINMLDSILGVFELGDQKQNTNKILYKSVVHYFMPFFPFTMKADRSNGKKQIDYASVEEVNLKLSKIMCSIGNDYNQHLSDISTYIEHALNKKKNINRLTVVVVRLVVSSPRESRKLLDKCERAFYGAKKQEDKITWLSFFLALLDLCGGFSGAWYRIAHLCVKILPNVTDVLDNDNIEQVDKVLSFLNQYTATKRAGSICILPDFIRKILRIGGIWEQSKLREKLVMLSYWLPSYDQDFLEKFRLILMHDCNNMCYFLELLEWRMSSNLDVCPLHVYISFLFSLLCCDKDCCNYDGDLENLDGSKSTVLLQVRKNLNALRQDDRQIRFLHDSFHSRFLKG